MDLIFLPEQTHRLTRVRVQFQHPYPPGVLASGEIRPAVRQPLICTGRASSKVGLRVQCHLQCLGERPLAEQLIKAAMLEEVQVVQIGHDFQSDGHWVEGHVHLEACAEALQLLRQHGLHTISGHTQDVLEPWLVAFQRTVAFAPAFDAGLAEVDGMLPPVRLIIRVAELDEHNIACRASLHGLEDLLPVLPQRIDLVHHERAHAVIRRCAANGGQELPLGALPTMAELVLVDPHAAEEVTEHSAQRAFARAHQASNDKPKLPPWNLRGGHCTA